MRLNHLYKMSKQRGYSDSEYFVHNEMLRRDHLLKSNTIDVIRKEDGLDGHEVIMMTGIASTEIESPTLSANDDWNSRIDMSDKEEATELLNTEEKNGDFNDGKDVKNGNSLDFFHILTEKQRVTDVINLLTMITLLICEFLSWIFFYINLKEDEKTHILLSMVLPTIFNFFFWLLTNWNNKKISSNVFCLMTGLLLFSIPSPLAM